MQKHIYRKIIILAGALLLSSISPAHAGNTENRVEQSLTHCYQRFEKQLGQSQYKPAALRIERCGRELQNAINNQLSMDLLQHTSQIEAMTKKLGEAVGKALIPFLIFENVEPIGKNHLHRLNNVQKYLIELRTLVKENGDAADIERAAGRFDKAVASLEQNVPGYDLSQYTALKDGLLAEATVNLEKREKNRIARSEAMSMARNLERLRSGFYLSGRHLAQWQKLGSSTGMKPVLGEWRQEYQDAPDVLEALDAIQNAYHRLEATADKYLERDFDKLLYSMAEYRDGTSPYYDENISENMRHAAATLKSDLDAWSTVHPGSAVIAEYRKAYGESAATLEKRILAGEKAQRKRLLNELKNRTLPESTVRQDKDIQEQVLISLQSHLAEDEHLDNIKRVPWQTSETWLQENHPLTGVPQSQSAVFRAGVMDGEGDCHVVKMKVSRIHTGGGNWSTVKVDDFSRDYPILCDRL